MATIAPSCSRDSDLGDVVILRLNFNDFQVCLLFTTDKKCKEANGKVFTFKK